MTHRRNVLLVILDGVGINPDTSHNALHIANIPYMKQLMDKYPHTSLSASGTAVGLPSGQMGSSEIGHAIIGSGIVLLHDLMRINQAINEKSLETKSELNALFHKAQAKKIIHLIGLVSDGGVHSHSNHLIELMRIASNNNITPVVHAITDGRDTPPASSNNYLRIIQKACDQYQGIIASVHGRYYTMDRDNRLERTAKGFKAFTGENPNDSWQKIISTSHQNKIMDEFIIPSHIKGSPIINKDDAMLFFNFRTDRMRQITRMFIENGYTQFSTMTEYDPEYTLPVLFPTESVTTTLGKTISDYNLNQLRVAESEKFAHVTYFFNNKHHVPYPREERMIIPSPDVASYDLAPEMSAPAVTDTLIKQLELKNYQLVVLNYANGDMVGHTAIQPAIIKAIECLDNQLKRLIPIALKSQYSVILTADHGNCDEMLDKNQDPHTQHSLHPVPCIIIDPDVTILAPHKTEDGLKVIAPTVLTLMGLPVSPEIDGVSLVTLD